MAAQAHDGSRVQPQGAAFFLFHTGDQFVDQQGNIFDPITQGGHIDGKNIQPVVQVFTEAAGFDQLFEILVCRRNNPHVGGPGAITADAFEVAILHQPKHLHLGVQGQLADIIQEQGSAVGQFTAPGPLGDGTGKGSPFIAKQLAFKQVRRYGTAVYRHEGLIATIGMVVQVPGDHLLARSGFSGDQHADVPVGDLLHQIAHLLYATACAHQAAKQLDTPLVPAAIALVKLGTVHLGPVQGIDKLGVIQGPFKAGDNAAGEISGQVGSLRPAGQQHRQSRGDAGKLLKAIP